MRTWEIHSFETNIIEDGSEKDIMDKLCARAAAYTKQWRLDTENPDIGSVTAILFSKLMADNARRYNALPGKLYTDFINLAGISQKSAVPAETVVCLSLVRDTVPSLFLPEGTKLIAKTKNGENPVFETAFPISLTPARLFAAFQTAADGRTEHLWGSFPHPVLTPETDDREDGTLFTEETETLPSGREFSLFDCRDAAFNKEALLIYHPWMFDGDKSEVTVHLPGAAEIFDGLEAGKFSLLMYGQGGFRRFSESRRLGEDALAVKLEGGCKKIFSEGESVCALALLAEEPAEHTISAEGIDLTSCGKPESPEMVYDGITELNPEAFFPFGDTLSVHSGLWIGGTEYFGRPGARVTLRFTVEHGEKYISWPAVQEQEELKIIRRKTHKRQQEAPAHVYAREISVEYCGKDGWRRLPTESPAAGILDTERAGEAVIAFCCPPDWRESEAGGRTGRFLRIRLLKADDCYMIPAVHHYPVIKNMKISYTYDGAYVKPGRLEAIRSVCRQELTERLYSGAPVPVFTRPDYADNSLYLGFDRKMAEGPVSLLFRIEETTGLRSGRLLFSCSAPEGFRRLKVWDLTDGLKKTGTISFFPPPEMTRRKLEGVNAFWIRITAEDGARHPLVTGIDLNAVKVRNTDTREEEEFYMDEAAPDMEFSLNAPDIFTAQVWVNENRTLSPGQKKKLLEEAPRRVQAEYGLAGEMTRFFVKWEETDSFHNSKPGDRHYVLDRAGHRIIFGDGVNVMIPRETQDTAFKVRAVCCDGEKANVDAGGITEGMGNLMFVDNITNPVAASGGRNMESAPMALFRGTALYAGAGRLLSPADYERESLCHCPGAAEAKAVCGLKKDGSRDSSCISIVLLMEDYQKGSFSFHRAREELREYFGKRCEASVTSKTLCIEEPFFVDYNVTVWASAPAADGYSVQKRLVSALEEYLDPARGRELGIGRLPTQSAISLKLEMQKGDAVIKRLLVTAGWRDEKGYHEAEPERFAGNPFAAPRSGLHRVYVDAAETDAAGREADK